MHPYIGLPATRPASTNPRLPEVSGIIVAVGTETEELGDANVLHFRADDAVISWRTVARSRFVGRVVAWASPRSVAVAPMAGHSGPVPRLGAA